MFKTTINLKEKNSYVNMELEKIAYIRGYNDSLNDSTYNIFEKYLNKYYNIIEIDYDKENINIDNIKHDLQNLGISKVIGISVGGFIALNLGSEFKKIVFNPCMKPSVELLKIGVPQNIIYNYSKIESNYFKNLKGDKLDKLTTYGFFSDYDEIFGAHGYKFLFKAYYRNGYNIKCGHKLEDLSIKKLVHRIKNFFQK